MAKKRYYAVKKGHVPGIYGNAEDYAKQITGYSCPESRAFKTYAEAEKYMRAPAAPKPKPCRKPTRPKRYYAVKKGRQTGIFTTLGQYDAAVLNYPGPEGKSFADLESAQEYMCPKDSNRYMSESIRRPDLEGLKAATAYVDGSYSPVTGRCGYGAILLCSGLEVHIRGMARDKYDKKNAAGEIYAAMAAMMYCAARGIRKLYLYYDFSGIASWLGAKKPYGLAMEYLDFVSRLKYVVDVEFIKVKAHAGIPLNERADKLAKEACGYDCWQRC